MLAKVCQLTLIWLTQLREQARCLQGYSQALNSRKIGMNVLELLNQWPWGAVDWLVIGLGVALAYIVFGIAGFGTALVAGPI